MNRTTLRFREFQISHAGNRQYDRQPRARHHRSAPQQAEPSRGGLFDLKICRTCFMRLRRPGPAESSIRGSRCAPSRSLWEAARWVGSGGVRVWRLGRRSHQTRIVRNCGQTHGVSGTHVLVRLRPSLSYPLIEPRLLHFGFDHLECGHTSGNHGIDKHKMPAITGFDGPLPGTSGEFLDALCKLRPEFLGNSSCRDSWRLLDRRLGWPTTWGICGGGWRYQSESRTGRSRVCSNDW